jgi:hypothetical protein
MQTAINCNKFGLSYVLNCLSELCWQNPVFVHIGPYCVPFYINSKFNFWLYLGELHVKGLTYWVWPILSRANKLLNNQLHRAEFLKSRTVNFLCFIEPRISVPYTHEPTTGPLCWAMWIHHRHSHINLFTYYSTYIQRAYLSTKIKCLQYQSQHLQM